ncbi:ABC transporter permease [Kribbella sp. NBC_01245]|uniref:ABC transporter permease n=1 Tax=Kribbella sp. NBC_01245 TaxID=2903578 RepID=UPI002E2DAE8E|nr:ABC transporter permease [Kribbella sp. NBC_01245]
MSSLTLALTDSATMLRRNLLHAARYPGLSLGSLGMPVIMLLLFVYVFGGAIGPAAAGGGEYIDYLVPGILLMAVAAGSISTAVAVCTDMTEGIIARFRTMAIFRPSVLTGHVIGSMILTMGSLVLVVGVGLLMGFRPNASFGDWLGAAAILAAITFAFTWLAVAMGLVSQTPEAASNVVLPLQFLPFLSSTFVPVDSMPSGLRWFAEYQPFTPITETIRGLLMGTPIGNQWIYSIIWCAVITVIGYLWSRAAYRKDPSR